MAATTACYWKECQVVYCGEKKIDQWDEKSIDFNWASKENDGWVQENWEQG
jgi:hypothetical protein